MNPGIRDSDFSLSRKLTVAGVVWAVSANITPAAGTGALIVLPGAAQGLVIPYILIDASAATVLQIGTATGVGTPVAVTPVNMNIGANNNVTFTAFSSISGLVTGGTPYFRADINATVQALQIDLSNNGPFVVPAGSATGVFVGTTTAFTGTLRFTFIVQEYPY